MSCPGKGKPLIGHSSCQRHAAGTQPSTTCKHTTVTERIPSHLAALPAVDGGHDTLACLTATPPHPLSHLPSPPEVPPPSGPSRLPVPSPALSLCRESMVPCSLCFINDSSRHELFIPLIRMLILAFPADTVLHVAAGHRRRLGTDRQIDKVHQPNRPRIPAQLLYCCATLARSISLSEPLVMKSVKVSNKAPTQKTVFNSWGHWMSQVGRGCI